DKTEFKSTDEFVNFTVWVDIESVERIPIENLTLNITGVTNESCKFYTNGTAISGCDNITITPINTVGYGNGTRYGYDRNEGYGYSFGSGYGYGYVSGYGYDQTDGAELSYNISWNLSKAKVLNGAYNATLYAYTSGGGTEHIFSSNDATQFTVDRSPVISSISVSNIKHNAATINWNTDVNSTGKIEYGTTTSYGSEVTLSNSVKVHHRRITGLSASTTYHYRIYAYDSAGNINISSDKTFTTSESPGQSGSAVGGGGGGGGASSTGNTVQTDSTGKVTSTTTIKSSDGATKAIIEEGTIALDENGKPLKSISMSSTVVGGTIAAYNLGPSGATFDPPITLSFTFEPKDILKGETVVIKMFDGTSWVSLKTKVTG
ncbi:MAG: fibronectin type III domain-containing protein, partial [Halobacteriota archaeon]|nr:fibronectin type III domain-containing protein [Halobacteriota archaeon]